MSFENDLKLKYKIYHHRRHHHHHHLLLLLFFFFFFFFYYYYLYYYLLSMFLSPCTCNQVASLCLLVCSDLTSLVTLSVISRRCLVVTGSSMLTLRVLPHCGIRSQTFLPDTTFSHIILTPERPVLALPRKSECQVGSNQYHC